MDLSAYLNEVNKTEKEVNRSDLQKIAMSNTDVTDKHLKRGLSLYNEFITKLGQVGKNIMIHHILLMLHVVYILTLCFLRFSYSKRKC